MSLRRIFPALVLAIFLVSISLAGSAYGIVDFGRVEIDGTTVEVLSVKINPLNYNLRVELASNFPGTDEPFQSMVGRTAPIAAINGTFFSKNSLLPVGDIVIDGILVHFGGLGTALTVSTDGKVGMTDVPLHKRVPWEGYVSVLAAGPRLIKDGKIDLRPTDQGFSDPHVLGSARRMAIGITKSDKLIFVAINSDVTLQETAKIMQKLGCINAMNNDGGSSMGMYFKGDYIYIPERRITNILAILPKGRVKQLPERLKRVAKRAQASPPSYYYDLGLRKLGEKDYQAAVKNLSEAASLDGENASYALKLAQVHLLNGDQEQAGYAYREAGERYIRKGLRDEAEINLRKSLELNQNDVDAHKFLASVLRAKGIEEEARYHEKIAERLSFENAIFTTPEKVLGGGDTGGLGSQPPVLPFNLILAQISGEGFNGSFNEGVYEEKIIGFKVSVPEGWFILDKGVERKLSMFHGKQPYYATLQAFEVSPEETVISFEEKFIAGTYRTEIAYRFLKLSGYDALESLYEEIINGRSVGERFLYARKGRWMIVISYATYAENYSEAAKDFNYITRNLALDLMSEGKG